jgi:diaminopimelate decarboxylase
MTLLGSVYERLRADGRTPAIVYFERILSETLGYFRNLTADVPRSKCLYSVKAATFPFLIRTLHRHGIDGFDASSATEACFLARLLGRKAPLYVTAPALTADELAQLARISPACIHLDSFGSMAQALKQNPQLQLGIRVNPGLSYSQQALFDAGGQRSRLGLPLSDLRAALELFKRHGQKRVGLHLHVTCEATDFSHQTRAVEFVSEALTELSLDGCTLTHLDIGGGYRPPRWDFARNVLVPQFDATSTSALSEAISRFIDRHTQALAPDFQVLLEPGHLLVKAAAVLVSQVLEERRDLAGNEHLILDTNINHFPKLLHYGRTPTVLIPQEGGTRRVTLAGNSCLGGDHIAQVDLEEHAHPEFVVFDDRGSYEYAKYNFFNGRFRPSVYLYDENSLMHRCKTDDDTDLIAYWREEARAFPEPYQSIHHFEDIVRTERGLSLSPPEHRMMSSCEFDPRAVPSPPGLLKAFQAGFSHSASINGRSLGPTEVREQIAAFENRRVGRGAVYTAERVAWTLDTANAIWLTLETILGGGLRRLLCPCPTHHPFLATASQRNIPWDAVHQAKSAQLTAHGPVDVWQLLPSANEIIDAVDRTPDIGALVLVSPGVPHGCGYSMEDIRRLTDKAQKDGWILIVDETLAGLALVEPKETDWNWLMPEHPVVRIASISTTFGLRGLRLGYLCATSAASRRPDSDEKIFERMATLADTTYSAPPVALAPILLSGLDILEKWRSGLHSDPDVMQHEENLARLRGNAKWVSGTLNDWGIPHIMPHAGDSVSACLRKLPSCRDDTEPFFRGLLRQHGLVLEMGGQYNQNPDWNFTLARVGIARSREALEADLLQLCRFYDTYRPHFTP